MAETEQTFAQLQTLLADNIARDISPRDLRDGLLATALGGYASIFADGNAVVQALTAVFVKLTPFDTAGPERGASADLPNDEILVAVAGDYWVSFDATVRIANAVADVELRANGVRVAGMAAATFQGSGLPEARNHFSFARPITLAAADRLSVYGAVSVDQSVTIVHARLTIKRVG